MKGSVHTISSVTFSHSCWEARWTCSCSQDTGPTAVLRNAFPPPPPSCLQSPWPSAYTAPAQPHGSLSHGGLAVHERPARAMLRLVPIRAVLAPPPPPPGSQPLFPARLGGNPSPLILRGRWPVSLHTLSRCRDIWPHIFGVLASSLGDKMVMSMVMSPPQATQHPAHSSFPAGVY